MWKRVSVHHVQVLSLFSLCIIHYLFLYTSYNIYLFIFFPSFLTTFYFRSIISFCKVDLKLAKDIYDYLSCIYHDYFIHFLGTDQCVNITLCIKIFFFVRLVIFKHTHCFIGKEVRSYGFLTKHIFNVRRVYLTRISRFNVISLKILGLCSRAKYIFHLKNTI